MSYARMSGEYSDLYLFSTVWDLKHGPVSVWECMSCKLMPKITDPVSTDVLEFWRDLFGVEHPDTYTYIPSSIMFNIKAVYRHLRHHMMRGHKVPIETIQRIVAEYYEVPVSRLQELWPHESWEFEDS